MEPDVIIVECGSSKPHGEHAWREGFMGLRKRKCGGRPKLRHEETKTVNQIRAEAGLPSFVEAPEHRCHFKLTKRILIGKGTRWPAWHLIDHSNYGWQCECGLFKVRDKIAFRDQMTPNRWKKLEQTWPS